MNRFYPDIQSLEALTLSLQLYQDAFSCHHCQKVGQLISHGYVYKQITSQQRQVVGKRVCVLCSRRYGRSGCGRTRQLYVAQFFPSFRYGAAHLFVFMSLILIGQTIDEAYYQATGQPQTRHAGRWLQRLMFKLSELRSFLQTQPNAQPTLRQRLSRRLKLLLPSHAQLVSRFPQATYAHFQLQAQLSPL